ncbi:MAG: hypothetical protein GF350_15665 [Chitinivibrionales bacterium]|nr:hypothetical protein [Chitinivibrionales bacterium]
MIQRMVKIAAVLLGVAAGIFLVISLGLGIAARRLLDKPVQLGSGTLQVTDPSITRGFGVRARSAVYRTPGATLRAAGISIAPSPVLSLLMLRPSLSLRIDSLVDTLTGPPRVPEIPDSLPLPSIPSRISVHAGIGCAALYRRTTLLLIAGQTEISFRNGRVAEVEIDSAVWADAVNHVPVTLRARAEKTLTDSVHIGLRARTRGNTLPGDSIAVALSAKAGNLMNGRGAVSIYVHDSRVYKDLMPLPRVVRPLTGLRCSLTVARAPAGRIALVVSGTAPGLQKTGPIRPGKSNIRAACTITGPKCTWRIRGNGESGTRIALNGECSGVHADSLLRGRITPRTGRVAVRGHISNVPVVMPGRQFRAGLRIVTAVVDRNGISGMFHTADSSRIETSLQWNKDGLRGPVDAHPVPRERWMTAFTDTNVRFESARIRGFLSESGFSFTLAAQNVRAYGTRADTVRAHQRVTASAYILDSATVGYENLHWAAQGIVPYRPADTVVKFDVAHKSYGAAGYRFIKNKKHFLTIDNLHMDALPWDASRELPVKVTSLAGTFRFDISGEHGMAALAADGLYRNRMYHARTRARWNSDTLRVDTLEINSDSGAVSAGLTAGISTLAGLRDNPGSLAGIDTLSLALDSVYIPDLLGLFMRSPPLDRGGASGKLVYNRGTGFRGKLGFHDVRFRDNAPVSVDYLAVTGARDTLVVSAIVCGRVASDEHVQQPDTGLPHTAFAVVGEDAAGAAFPEERLKMQSFFTLDNAETLSGLVLIKGGFGLPEGAGALRKVDIAARAALPLYEKEFAPVLHTTKLTGAWGVPGLDTNTITGTVKYAHRELVLDSLRLRSRNRTAAAGHARVIFDSVPHIDARLQGAELGFAPNQLTTVSLGLFDVRANGSVNNPDISLFADTMQVRYGRLPFRVDATLAKSTVDVDAVGSSSRAGTPAQAPLRVKGSTRLVRSRFSYRVGSLSALRNILNGSSAPRGYARPSREINLDIGLRTVSGDNRIQADFLNIPCQAAVRITGTYPHMLVDGRVYSERGTIGAGAQEFDISDFSLQWNNERVERGDVELTAGKTVASSCDSDDTVDSCTVYTYLEGTLANAQFSYSSDCGAADAADITSLALAVRRGCYTQTAMGAGTGGSVGGQALSLLEPGLNRQLTDIASRFTENWIAEVNVSGLGALVADSAQQPFRIRAVSKKFMRFTLNGEAIYQAIIDGAETTWEYALSLQWEPPLDRWIPDNVWKRRLEGNLTLQAGVRAEQRQGDGRFEDAVRQRAGIGYTARFWKLFGRKNDGR